jgi:hypothetical protein
MFDSRNTPAEFLARPDGDLTLAAEAACGLAEEGEEGRSVIVGAEGGTLLVAA